MPRKNKKQPTPPASADSWLAGVRKAIADVQQADENATHGDRRGQNRARGWRHFWLAAVTFLRALSVRPLPHKYAHSSHALRDFAKIGIRAFDLVKEDNRDIDTLHGDSFGTALGSFIDWLDSRETSTPPVRDESVKQLIQDGLNDEQILKHYSHLTRSDIWAVRQNPQHELPPAPPKPEPGPIETIEQETADLLAQLFELAADFEGDVSENTDLPDAADQDFNTELAAAISGDN